MCPAWCESVKREYPVRIRRDAQTKNQRKMTTEQILREDRKRLKQVNEAIASLRNDKRDKSQKLLHKFQEMRENLEISIESNETALKLERQFAGRCGNSIIVFMP